jgi:hypothetical protein
MYCRSKLAKHYGKTSKLNPPSKAQMSSNTTPCSDQDFSQLLSIVVDRCVDQVDLDDGPLENALWSLLTEILAYIPKGSVTIVPAQAEFSINSRGMTMYTHVITVRDTPFHVHITY